MLLPVKFESSIHNIVFSTENVIMSESGEKYAQTKHMMFLTSENSPKRILGHIFMWEGNRGWGLFNGGNHIMDYWTGILAKGLDFYDGFVTQKHTDFHFTRC